MAPIVVLLLQLVSNDCSLPGLSSLGLRPALTVGVVGRVAARVLKGKPAGFCVGTTSVAASIVDSAMFYTLKIKFNLLMLANILCDYLAELV